MEEKEGSPAGGGTGDNFFILFIFSRVGIWGGSIYVLKPPLRDADDSHNSICTIPYNTSLQDFPFSGRGDEEGKERRESAKFLLCMYFYIIYVVKNGGEGRERAFVLGRSIISYIEKICLLHVHTRRGSGGTIKLNIFLKFN